ncbi:hypothetical protein P3T23_005086 [Paraburkholderia sp. GAS448]
MNHWKPELQAIDVSAWPTVGYLSPAAFTQQFFKNQIAA